MKIIKALSLFTLCFLLSAPVSLAQNWWKSGIKGEGPLVEKEINMSAFHSIELSIGANVILQQGSTQKVVVKGQNNMIQNLKTNVKNGAWDIEFKKNASKYKEMTVYITLPSLQRVAVSGSGNVKGKTPFNQADNMKVSISGSGDVNLHVETNQIKCSISGSGTIKLQGSATEQQVGISGSGDIRTFNMPVERCEVKISGSGDCQLHVKEKLKVSIAGSGDVVYKGGASVRSSIAGSGDVREAN